MEYVCPKCCAKLKYIDNKYICEYCKSEYNFIDLYDNNQYIIPFKLTKKDAIRKYKSLIKTPILTPSIFKHSIKNIEAIYVPCCLYDFEASGNVSMESDLISTWKSDNKSYKKIDTYKNIRDGHMSLENICVICNDEIDDDTISLIEPYDFNDLNSYDNSYKDYKTYPYSNDKEKNLSLAQNKARNYFSKIMQEDIKEFRDIKTIDNSINLYNTKMRYIYLPVWKLDINYKNKKFKFLINGLTGNIYGKVLINKKRLILIWIVLFIVIFTLLLVLDIYVW